MALLKRLRGKPAESGDKQGLSATAGARQMKMLRRLPKLLRFIPGTAQDVRAYFLTLQYWLAGSEDNFAHMIHFLVDRYASGPRKALSGVAPVPAPLDYPKSASTTRACRAACRSPRKICRAARLRGREGPSGYCCCAPIPWPATQDTTMA